MLIVGSEQKVVRPEATATGPWGMQEAGWRACDQSYSIPLTSSSTCMGAVSICPFSVRSCPLIASPQYSPTQLQYNLTDIAAEMSRSPSVGRSLWLYVAKAADGKSRLRPAFPTTLPMLEWIAVSFTPLLTELLSSRCRKPDRRRAMSDLIGSNGTPRVSPTYTPRRYSTRDLAEFNTTRSRLGQADR